MLEEKSVGVLSLQESHDFLLSLASWGDLGICSHSFIVVVMNFLFFNSLKEMVKVAVFSFAFWLQCNMNGLCRVVDVEGCRWLLSDFFINNSCRALAEIVQILNEFCGVVSLMKDTVTLLYAVYMLIIPSNVSQWALKSPFKQHLRV